MIRFSVLCCIIVSSFFTLAQKVHAQENDKLEDILVLEKNDTLPPNAIAKGRIVVNNKGMPVGCSYLETIAHARVKAKRKKANVIHITRIRVPKRRKVCFKIWANLYSISDTRPYIQEQQRKTDSIQRSLIADTAQYAILYLFRPYLSFGSLINYQINADKTPIGRIINGFAYKVKLTKEGEVTLWASTESKTSYTLQVKFGRVYFIHCGVQRGLFIGLPDIHLVRPEKGIIAYQRIRANMERNDPTDTDEFYNRLKKRENAKH